MLLNIKELIGEATEYDKKLALEEKKPKSWCKSVSAFANTLGGSLIFGVSNEGEVIGLQDADHDAEKISEIIKTRIDPLPEFNLRFHKTDDGKVLIILDIFKNLSNLTLSSILLLEFSFCVFFIVDRICGINFAVKVMAAGNLICLF